MSLLAQKPYVKLAKRGATVAVVRRNELKGAALVDQSGDLTGTIAFNQADLASQSVVRSLAESVKREYDRTDVLAHNAGLSAGSRRGSPDRIDLTLAVNHLAPYLLAFEPLDYLRGSSDPRVVVTASDIHRWATLDFDDLQLADVCHSLNAYARSKLPNIAFTVELNDQLPDGSAVTVNCFHPRFIPSTELFRKASLRTRLLVRIAGLVPGVVTSKQAAADRLQRLLVDRRYGSICGQYVSGDGPAEPAPEGTDRAVRHHFWWMSADLVGIVPGWPTETTD